MGVAAAPVRDRSTKSARAVRTGRGPAMERLRGRGRRHRLQLLLSLSTCSSPAVGHQFKLDLRETKIAGIYPRCTDRSDRLPLSAAAYGQSFGIAAPSCRQSSGAGRGCLGTRPSRVVPRCRWLSPFFRAPVFVTRPHGRRKKRSPQGGGLNGPYLHRAGGRNPPKGGQVDHRRANGRLLGGTGRFTRTGRNDSAGALRLPPLPRPRHVRASSGPACARRGRTTR